MSPDEHRRVTTLDLAAIVEAIHDAGGPAVVAVGKLPGGEVGAGLVRYPDGPESVVTWAPPPRPGTRPRFTVDGVLAMLEVACAVGNPGPRYEAVVPLADGGVAVLQERIDGVPVSTVSPVLVDQAVSLALARRGALAGRVPPPPPTKLFLRESGAGFCHHDTLRTFDDETRALLAQVEAVGRDIGDELAGTDLVHFDYTMGNVLVAPDDPDRLVAVVDWDGAGMGDVTFDLVVLAFDLSWRAPALAEVVEARTRAGSDDARYAQCWAHISLRLVDWSIRHHPNTVAHWLSVSRRAR